MAAVCTITFNTKGKKSRLPLGTLSLNSGVLSTFHLLKLLVQILSIVKCCSVLSITSVHVALKHEVC